jgi:glycosyltransferase involved in cell wall biosynthesis
MTSPDPVLSLCMIVRNEENDLPACLAEVSALVDEIVIVDTGSTDRTRDIAREHGARLVEMVWADDFALARNEALRHARGRWILSLDADERLDYMNGHHLRKAIRMVDQSPEGEEILALALLLESEVGKPGSGLITRHVFPRVFRNREEIRWKGALHEQVVHRELDLMSRTRLTDVVVQHLGYARDADNRERRDRNSRVVESTSGERTLFDRVSFAHTEMNQGRFTVAARELEALVEGGLPHHLDATARWSLAQSLLALGRRDDARRALGEGEARFPEHHSYPYSLALLDLEDGHAEAARVRLDDLLGRASSPYSERTDLVPARSTLRVHRARVAVLEGDPLRALREVETVLTSEPGHPEARFQRAFILSLVGRVEEALDILEVLDHETPDQPAVSHHLARCRSSVTRRHRPGLTLAVIARNEARNLEDLIPSVSGLTDEVVVVDTGSDDDTVEVARRLGAVVVSRAWDDDFAAARNAGLDAVSRKWVLWLDGDERLDPAAWPTVRAAMAGDGVEGVSLRLESSHREDDPVARTSGRYCRLFRADVGARFEGRVHEQILPALERTGARVIEADVRVLHTGYALDAAALERKKIRNLRLLERMALETPDDFYVWFQIGTTEVTLGRFTEAIAPLVRAGELAPPNAPEEILLWIELRLAQARFVCRDHDGALAHARAARRRRPGLDLADYLEAGVWARRQRPARALACLRRILHRSHADPIAPLRREAVAAEFARLRDALAETARSVA